MARITFCSPLPRTAIRKREKRKPGTRGHDLQERVDNEIDPPSAQAGKGAQGEPDSERDGLHGEAHHERRADAVDDPAEQVPPHLVGAQQMSGRGELQVVDEAGLVEALRREQQRKDGAEHQDADDHEPGHGEPVAGEAAGGVAPEGPLPDRARTYGSCSTGGRAPTGARAGPRRCRGRRSARYVKPQSSATMSIVAMIIG